MEGFKLRMMREGESNKQSCEGVADRIVQQRDGVMGRNHKINKIGLKQGHLQYWHVSKEVPYKAPL